MPNVNWEAMPYKRDPIEGSCADCRNYYCDRDSGVCDGCYRPDEMGVIQEIAEQSCGCVYVDGGKIKWTAATPEPPPQPAGGPDIQDLVLRDILDRKAAGVKKYGTALRANNGRDALMDAYQEALDLACYLRQAIEERL